MEVVGGEGFRGRVICNFCCAHISFLLRKMRGNLGWPERQRTGACNALRARRNRFVRQEVLVELGAVVLLHHHDAPGAVERARERLDRQR